MMDDTKRIKHGRFVSAKKIREEAEGIQKLVRARIGDTPVKRLAWLLRFMNTDLEFLRKEEQTALGHDLQTLWLAVDAPEQAPPVGVWIMDRSELSATQKWIKDGFLALFSEKPKGWIFPAPREMRLVRKSSLDAKRSDITLVPVWPVPSDFDGQRRNIKLAILYIVFAARDSLRLCSECKSPFIPVRRQEYCSTKCSQKARDRKRKPK